MLSLLPDALRCFPYRGAESYGSMCARSIFGMSIMGNLPVKTIEPRRLASAVVPGLTALYAIALFYCRCEVCRRWDEGATGRAFPRLSNRTPKTPKPTPARREPLFSSPIRRRPRGADLLDNAFVLELREDSLQGALAHVRVGIHDFALRCCSD